MSWEKHAHLNVVLLRHGESTNNVLLRRLTESIDDMQLKEHEWMSQRNDDPGLTPLGQEQAECAAQALACDPILRLKNNALVYTSGFLRCMQTAQPLATALDVPVIVHPDIYEVGGVYTFDDDGKCRVGGTGMSVRDMARRFPTYDTSALPSEGSWYTGPWETDAMSRVRCQRVAQWLRSPQLRTQAAGRTVVLVVHGHFISTLLSALCNIDEDAARDVKGHNMYTDRPVFFASRNTGVAHFVVTEHSVMIMRAGDVSHLHPMLEAAGSASGSARTPQRNSLSFAIVSALPVLLALNSVRVYLSSRL